MLKNIIISLMAAGIVASQDAVAYCRGAEALGVFTVCFVIIRYTEEKYRQECRRRRRMRRLQRRIRMLAKEAEISEREI